MNGVSEELRTILEQKTKKKPTLRVSFISQEIEELPFILKFKPNEIASILTFIDYGLFIATPFQAVLESVFSPRATKIHERSLQVTLWIW